MIAHAKVRGVADDPAELIGRIAAQGDRDAFRTLYDQFAPRVTAYLRRAGCAPDVARDLTQEVMTTVWQRAGTYRVERAQVSTWIFCVARNRMIDRIRHERRPAPDPTDPAWRGAEPPGPEAQLGSSRTNAALHRALELLPAEQRAVLRASYLEGLSLADIAAREGIPLGTVKTRARLAIRRLRDELAATTGDDHV